MRQVTSFSDTEPYNLLTPVRTKPRENIRYYTRRLTLDEFTRYILKPAAKSDVVALDFETKGLTPLDPENETVGVGLAWSTGLCYVDLTVQDAEVVEAFFDQLIDLPLIAHNINFDGQWIYAYSGRHANWVADTYALYAHTATESNRRSWSLKTAQVELLGWAETNEAELDDWLVQNGYAKLNGQILDPEKILEKLADGKPVKPNKAEMWRAPADILGKYCALDADSTYQLYTQVFVPVLERFPLLESYTRNEFLTTLKLLIEQHQRGILVDVPALESYRQKVEGRIQELEAELFSHPDAAPHFEKYNRDKLEELAAKEPPRYKKFELGPEPAKYKKQPKEPKKLNKDGSISKSWLAWSEKTKDGPEVSANWLKWKAKEEAGPQQSKVWEAWRDKFEAAKTTQHFNLSSGPQLTWLLYSQMFDYEVKVPFEVKENGRKEFGAIVLKHKDGREIVELEHTKTGGLPTDTNALRWMGDFGKLLDTYKGTVKELTAFVEPYLEHTDEHGILRPGWRVPGTLTGRLSGKTPNIQQLTKSKEFLDCLVARPGYTLVDVDHTSLEPVVLANASLDPTMLALFGPNAKPNDIYLYVGSNLPVIGPILRSKGYDPENPTKEAISATKKAHKRERSIAKVFHLSASYGAGAKKIFKTLRLQGIDVTLNECYQMHKAYWQLFGGVVQYGEDLKEEWERNKGYTVNFYGRPCSFGKDRLKDLVNGNTQSAGHDAHLLFVHIVDQMIKDEGLEAYPWIVDFHDETIWEVKDEHVDAVVEIFGTKAYDEINRQLGWECKLKGEPEVSPNITGFKIEG